MTEDPKWQRLILGLEKHLGRSLSQDEARVAREMAEDATVLYGVSSFTFSQERDALHALASRGILPLPPGIARAMVLEDLVDALNERGGCVNATKKDIRECAAVLAREAGKRCSKGRRSSIEKDFAYGFLLDFYYCCVGVPSAARSNHASKQPSPFVRFVHVFIEHLRRDVRHWLFTTDGERIARLLPVWRTKVARYSVPYMRRRLAGRARPLFVPVSPGLNEAPPLD
jgi:hypothetical protein